MREFFSFDQSPSHSSTNGAGEMAERTLLVGRTISMTIDLDAEPVWQPLEAIAGISDRSTGLPCLHMDRFMYMAAVANRRKHLRVHLYKHIDTRRYLNIDDAGHAYAFWRPPADDTNLDDAGGYRAYRSLADAIGHVLR